MQNYLYTKIPFCMTTQPKQIQACHGILPREKLLAFHSSIYHLGIGWYGIELCNRSFLYFIMYHLFILLFIYHYEDISMLREVGLNKKPCLQHDALFLCVNTA